MYAIFVPTHNVQMHEFDFDIRNIFLKKISRQQFAFAVLVSMRIYIYLFVLTRNAHPLGDTYLDVYLLNSKHLCRL